MNLSEMRNVELGCDKVLVCLQGVYGRHWMTRFRCEVTDGVYVEYLRACQCKFADMGNQMDEQYVSNGKISELQR